MSADITVVKAESSTETDAKSKPPNASQEPTLKITRIKKIGANIGNRKYTEFHANNVVKKRFLKNVSTQQKGLNERVVYEKLNDISGPTYDLPPLNTTEKKFSGRNRLYVGNLPSGIDENELAQLFRKYGETGEVFINKEKNFGFVKMDYRHNAEKAKLELNGTVFKAKTLKIRFAPNTAAIKVKNLDEHVTNELLHLAFSVFGEIDRSVVVLDAHGKSTRTGIVEFAKKFSSNLALRQCSENCFFLTSSLRPVIAEAYEAFDENDGLSEKFLARKNRDYYTARSTGPRFAAKDSFEHEYGMRWKHLHEMFAQKLEALKKENEIEEERLLAQMELARFEHETALLKEQLHAREVDMDRHKREWELKQQRSEENKRRAEELMRRKEGSIQAQMLLQEEELRRRQEESKLFLKVQQLDGMISRQEDVFKREANVSVETKTMVPAVYYHYTGVQYGKRSNREDYWNNEGVDETSGKRRRY